MSDNSLLENVDTAELLEHVDVENLLQNTDWRTLLKQVNLEAALGSFGAAVGREVGAVLGHKLGATLSSTESESTESENDEDESTEGESDTDDTDSDMPETREELEELPYRELQSLATDTNVKGNLSEEEMTDRLAEELGLGSE